MFRDQESAVPNPNTPIVPPSSPRPVFDRGRSPRSVKKERSRNDFTNGSSRLPVRTLRLFRSFRSRRDPLNFVRRAIIEASNELFQVVRGIFHEGRIKGLRKIAFNIILDDRFSSKPSARQESSRIPGLLPFLLRPVQTIEIIS